MQASLSSYFGSDLFENLFSFSFVVFKCPSKSVSMSCFFLSSRLKNFCHCSASFLHLFECVFGRFSGLPHCHLFSPSFTHPERCVSGIVDDVHTWGVLHKWGLFLRVPTTVAEQVQNCTKDELSLCLSLYLGLSKIGGRFWFEKITLSPS